MKHRALLVTGVLAVIVTAGCSDDNGTSPQVTEQSVTEQSVDASDAGGGPAASDGGGEDNAAPSGTVTVSPEEASGTPAPTVEAQEPGTPLAVAGAQLEPPEGWQVSGVSSVEGSETVSAVSEDGQFVSLRSVRTDATVDEQVSQALEADAEQTAEAPEIEADGKSLRGVQTTLTAGGGEAVQLQYFVRQGDSLVTLDVVTTPENRDALLEQLSSGLTWT